MSQVDFVCGVRVRVNAHDAAQFQCATVPAPVKIEAPWIGVDLDPDAILRARLQYALDVHLVPWPTQQLPTRHVAQDGGVWICDSP